MAKCASTSLTHNDFYPALVGEQTLTRSVILHNNFQEKENKFYYRDSFFRKSAMGYVFTQIQLENKLLQDQLYYIITTKKKKTSFTKGVIMSEKCQRLEKIFLITLLNYSIYVHDADKMSILIFFCIYRFNLCTGSESRFRGYQPLLLQQLIHYKYTVLL